MELTSACSTKYAALYKTIISALQHGLTDARDQITTARSLLSAVEELRSDGFGRTKPQRDAFPRVKAACETIVSCLENLLRSMGTASQQLVEFQNATLEPNRNQIRELELSLSEAVERTRITIIEHQNSMRGLQQRVVDLATRLGVLRQQAGDARTRTILFSVVSIARYQDESYKYRCHMTDCVDLQFSVFLWPLIPLAM